VATVAEPGARPNAHSYHSRRALAHDNTAMDCQICHTSWATSCFGCHLPMKANQRVPQNKFEGVTTETLLPTIRSCA